MIDYDKNTARLHCPQCGQPLHLRHAVDDRGADSYRVRCTNPDHYKGPWRPSKGGAFEAANRILQGEAR